MMMIMMDNRGIILSQTLLWPDIAKDAYNYNTLEIRNNDAMFGDA